MAAACQLRATTLSNRADDASADDDGLSEWFALQVWVGREAFAANHLRLRGYDIFLPCYEEYRRRSDRVAKIARALFAGYVFCRVRAKPFAQIVTSPGVIRIVGDSNGPLTVHASEIDAIRRIADTALAVEPWPYLTAGQRVRIEVGPLRDIDGVVLRVKNSQRLIVSVSLLQRAVAVEIDPAWLCLPSRC